jgi:diamine N-acetyltransferase
VARPRVRPATVDDRSELADLGRRTFVAAFGPDNDPADIQRYVDEAFSEARVAEQLTDPDSTFLVLEPTDGVGAPPATAGPIGYAHLRAGTDDAVQGERPVELVRLYVDPHLTGAGHGGLLLRAAMDVARARGHDVLWLGVWEHNLGARRFYERWGFEEVGSWAFVLGEDVQTDVIVARSLPPTHDPDAYPDARVRTDGGGAT